MNMNMTTCSRRTNGHAIYGNSRDKSASSTCAAWKKDFKENKALKKKEVADKKRETKKTKKKTAQSNKISSNDS